MALKRDTKGQLSVYDALIYFAFLLIATTILSFYSVEMEKNREFINDLDLSDYCEDTRKTVMRCTVWETNYTDPSGNKIIRNNITVESLLLEGLNLMNEGVEKKNISYYDDIYELASNLIRNDFEWLITARYKGTYIIISYNSSTFSNPDAAVNSMDGDVYSSSWGEPMIKEKEGTVSFNFYISEKWD